MYTWDFPNVIKFHLATLIRYRRKALRFWHPDYNLDRAQKLVSLSMSRHLSTRNISSKSMHAFLRNLANRLRDRQTQAKTFTSSFVGGKLDGVSACCKGSVYLCKDVSGTVQMEFSLRPRTVPLSMQLLHTPTTQASWPIPVGSLTHEGGRQPHCTASL